LVVTGAASEKQVLRVAEGLRRASRNRVDVIDVAAIFETVLERVAPKVILHPGRELEAVAVLITHQTESLTNKVALQRTARRVDETDEPKILTTIDKTGRSRGDRSDCVVLSQNSEVISHLRYIRHALVGDRVGALDVRPECELADEVRRKGRIHARRVVVAAGLDPARKLFGSAPKPFLVSLSAGRPVCRKPS